MNSVNEVADDEELHEEEKKRRLGSNSLKRGGAASVFICCQDENCDAELSEAKKYHRRHKVCELHSKAPAVVVAGLIQRFCQQCSRFHELSEFDDTKRSCRRRLVGHNERRRKSSTESKGEGSSQCRQADQDSSGGGTRVDIQINSMTGSSTPGYKHFQIR